MGPVENPRGRFMGLCSVLGGLLLLGSCQSSPAPLPETPLPETVIVPLEASRIKDVQTECPTEDGDDLIPCILNIPLDQLGVMMNAELRPDRGYQSLQQTLDTLDALGVQATLIGQIPQINLFQVGVAQPELDENGEDSRVISEAYDRLLIVVDALRQNADVLSVAFAWPMETREGAEPNDDNANLRTVSSRRRPALASIDYYQAIPIFDEIFGSRSNLHPVILGIIDSGLGLDTGQFDDIEITNVTSSPLTDREGGHGTNIIGLIAADNGDGGMNGIASRIINGPRGSSRTNKLSLAVGTYSGSLFSYLDSLQMLVRLVDAGANLVNLSIGYNRLNIRVLDGSIETRMPTSREFADARSQWVSVMGGQAADFSAARGVLYICAVPNMDITITTGNDFPSGIALNNVITVGAIDTATLFDRASRSASGGGNITIAAPSTDVPVMHRTATGGIQIVTRSGSSYSTAMISSMAAVMYAVNPSATPAQIKQFFSNSDHNYPADPAVGGRRASLLKTVGRYILAHGGTFARAGAFLDSLGAPDGNVDPPGYLINNHIIQGESTLEVTNDVGGTVENTTIHGATFHAASGRFINNSGGIMFTGDSTFVIKSQTVRTGFTFIPAVGFALGSYPISEGGMVQTRLIVGSTTSPSYEGFGVTGELTLSECEITTRSTLLDTNLLTAARLVGEDAWLFIQLRGAFHSRIEGIDYTPSPPLEPVYYEINVSFDTIFTLIDVDQATRDYLEQTCIGGYRYRDPSS